MSQAQPARECLSLADVAVQSHGEDQLKQLVTSRLRLRPPSEADAGFIAKLMTGRGYLQNIGERGVHSPEDAAHYLRTAPIYKIEDGMGFNIVELRSTDEPLGICGLVKRDAYPWPDVGYAILDGWEGQGYASEAAERVISHAFGSLQLPELLAVTTLGNRASQRVVEKLGMKLFGDPKDDVCVYRILAHEWENRPSSNRSQPNHNSSRDDDRIAAHSPSRDD